MNKTINIDFCNKVTEEKLGCVVEIIYGNGDTHRLGLIADMDRMIKTANFCTITKSIHPHNQYNMYAHILRLKENPIDFQSMCNVVLTYLGYFNEFKEYIEKHQNESLGLLMRVYSDEESMTEIIPKTWDQIKKIATNYRL
jgi:hypothetical protein